MANSRDEMSRFMNVVSEDLVEDCWEAMLHNNLDQGILMVYAQQVEESRRKRQIHNVKKPKAADQSRSSLGRCSFRVQKSPKFKRHPGNPIPSKDTNSKEGNDRNAERDGKSCDKCGRSLGCKCLVGTNACFGCGKTAS